MAADQFKRLKAALGDRYEIEREIGAGGMATVYVAEDLKLHRRVAIKVLRPELAVALGTERFVQEIELTAKLQHPQILPLYEAGEAEGFLYYVMPYVEGESLRHRLSRERQLSLEEALQIVQEVADGLGYAHSLGIVHRDIKPENVLLSGGHAVIADFGIARAINAAGAERLTETGLAVGTPAYMSPEQASGEQQLDGRADIYSLGCILYELLAGEPPFTGPSPQALMARHSLDPVPSLRTVRGTVPNAVERAISKALEKVPADRFATAAQFAEALSSLASEAVLEPERENAIVVFDFVNISEDASSNWLRGGIAETVTVDLKKTGRVKVIGRDRLAKALTAQERSGSGDVDPASLGRSLGARWAVSGGFQKSGQMIRITPQFVETATNEVVSAAKIDGEMDDLFALQDRIVTSLMEVLDVELSQSEVEKVQRPETAEFKAYECYAKGRQLFNQFGPKGFDQAREYFEQAIAIDSTYALAYSGLGRIFVFSYIATTRREDLETGIAHLQRAVELDPHVGEPHVWLTYAYVRQGRLAEANRAGERATELEPDLPYAHYFYGAARLIQALAERRWEGMQAAIPALVQAIHLDPSHQPGYMVLAWIYLLNGQYEVARPLLDRAVRIEETGEAKEIKFVGALTLRAALYLRQNELDPASALYQRAQAALSTSDHVYADAFTVLTLCGLGECAHRERAYDVAIQHFARAVQIIEANQQRLGIGYFLLKAQLGLAKAFHELRMRREKAEQFQQASQLFEHKEGYDFSWMWEGSDAQGHYDFANYHAAVGHRDEALAALEQAVLNGWGDLPSLTSDPAFTKYREDPGFAELRETVLARGRLPEPKLAALIT